MSINIEEMDDLKAIDLEKLKFCFDRLGLSMSQIAREMDLSRATIYNILSGKVYPNYVTIHILVNKLGLAVDEFIDIFFPDLVFKEKDD